MLRMSGTSPASLIGCRTFRIVRIVLTLKQEYRGDAAGNRAADCHAYGQPAKEQRTAQEAALSDTSNSDSASFLIVPQRESKTTGFCMQASAPSS